jgi:hypothetical protein
MTSNERKVTNSGRPVDPPHVRMPVDTLVQEKEAGGVYRLQEAAPVVEFDERVMSCVRTARPGATRHG